MDTVISESVGFNPALPMLLHIDLNSCFASIEQQANPGLRGKPVVVAAYVTAGGCVLTASREAKKIGIDTGMRVAEAKTLCPEVVVLPSDPWKYRYVNRKLLAILRRYTDDIEVKSIDEMVLDFEYAPKRMSLKEIGLELKKRIAVEIGDWLTVSIGISTNRYLAKIGAGLHKPDGLDTITGANIGQVLSAMTLEGLCGIKSGYGGRLRARGIASAMDFYRASISELKDAFHSIVGYHWWLRLHGWEADDRRFARKSFGQSYALYKQYPPEDVRVHQILCQLVEKMARRMRSHGFATSGIHVSCLFSDYSFWHKGKKLLHALYAGSDLYREALAVISKAPQRQVRILAVSCQYLTDSRGQQGELYADTTKKQELVRAVDRIADRWGDFTVIPARLLNMEHNVLDRIAFGGVKDLEEFAFRE